MIKSIQKIIIALSSLTISNVVLSTTNPVVSHGQVSISQNGNITNINQGSDSGVINWDTFNVDTGATVNFIQPNTASWTLNNVSLSYSDIKGTINANGNVILSNPHGILLHNGALIDVNSMILTTASLNKHDFINRNFSFSVDDANRYGAIINYGNIETDGPVALLASGIENHGVIISHLGDVNLAAGGGYAVDLSGQGLFSVQITGGLVAKARDKDGKALKHAIHNSGQVIAKNGAAIISAKAANNVIDNLLNVNGMVRAKSAHMDGGKIVLNSHNGNTVVGGELTVSSDNGSAGTIEILGDEIIIKNGARILADGKSGGEIYVGGSDKGQGPLPNSKKVKVEDGALISAKGHENHQSGKIILWGDDYFELSGKLDTSVGLDGFIETSSKKNFMLNGIINAGIHGSWLLDPRIITIDTGIGAYNSNEPDINSIGIDWLDGQQGHITLQSTLRMIINAWPDKNDWGDKSLKITFDSPWIKALTILDIRDTDIQLEFKKGSTLYSIDFLTDDGPEPNGQTYIYNFKIPKDFEVTGTSIQGYHDIEYLPFIASVSTKEKNDNDTTKKTIESKPVDSKSSTEQILNQFDVLYQIITYKIIEPPQTAGHVSHESTAESLIREAQQQLTGSGSSSFDDESSDPQTLSPSKKKSTDEETKPKTKQPQND